MSILREPTVRPFLKWAGGKYKLIPVINKHLQPGQRLIEPFVGAGALFLNVDYPRYLLNDNNRDLIHLYQTLQQQGDQFIHYAAKLFTPDNNTPERYYALRERFNTTRSTREKAALFIFLNRHSYNGLCRYNSKGEFNVPHGRYKNPGFPLIALQNFYQRAERAEFIHGDFQNIMQQAKAGDVIYCDPPYIPINPTGYAHHYSQGGFSHEQHQQLADQAVACAARGVLTIISNHDTTKIRKLYQQATIQSVKVNRKISCKGNTRKPVKELLAIFS